MKNATTDRTYINLLAGLGILAMVLPGLLQAQPVQQHGALAVSGNRIVNQNGQTVSFAGNSFFWSNDGWGGENFYTAGAVDWLQKDWKTTIVRAAMGVEASGGYIQSPASNKNKVKTIVDAGIARGMYVIIDWHSHSAQSYQSQAISFFEEMATTYGSYPNVIYEIYNEPDNESWSTIKTYAEAVIGAIRRIDPDNLIIVGTPTWSQDVDVASTNPITGYSNIAYTLHFYAATHKQSLRDKAQTALNNGIALMVTEWGTVQASGDGAVDEPSTREWMNFLDANQISHLNWAVNDKQEGASALLPGSSTTGGWTDYTTSGWLARDIVRNWPAPSPGQQPYGGTATALPGTLEAERFDEGGEGVAYHDTDATNNGGAFRTSESVDLEAASGGGFNVGWTAVGEWLEYTVNVQTTGTYTLSFRVASNSSGGSFHLDVDGQNVTGAMTVPVTGGWQIWTDVTKTGVSLSAGQHVLRFAVDQAGFNFDRLTVSGGTSITVRARGNCGPEDMRLKVNDTTVATWLNIGTSLTSKTYTNYSGGNVKVEFFGDGTSNGCDLNLFVDYIVVGSTTYQTETSATRTGCGDSQWLWCNGHFDFGNPSTAGTSITVRARGNCGPEDMRLRINDTAVATWNDVGTTLTNKTYNNYSGGNVKIEFFGDGTSNGCDLNLFVDYIVVGSTTYQTETSATRTGCGDSQWLWCNGHFDFGNPGTAGKTGLIADEAATPTEFALKANYPNPFNPSTLIVYTLPEATFVRLEVFDVTGRRVATLVDTSQPDGLHEVRFQADDLPSGVYLYRIQAGAFVQARKMQLIK